MILQLVPELGTYLGGIWARIVPNPLASRRLGLSVRIYTYSLPCYCRGRECALASSVRC
jgi:hypothetical protein